QVERLAHHAPRGEVWDKAVAYCRQAGEKAMERSALQPSGDYRRILTYLCEAEALAVALNDHRRLGQVLGFLSDQSQRMGAYHQARAYAQRTLALAAAGGEIVLQALANLYLGNTYQYQGDY